MASLSFPHFTLSQPAEGVFAAVAGRTGACVSNAAIVDLGDRTVIVDTFQTVQAAADLRTAAEDLTGRSAALVVTSHWHDDHHGGNQVFDDAEIVSTRRTVEIMAGNRYEDLDRYVAEIDRWVDRVRTMRDTAATEDARARADDMLKTASYLKDAAPGFRLTLPTPMEDDGFTLEGADRLVEVMTFGGGHTESDVFVHVPDAGVVIAGDLLWVGQHPRAQDGDPSAWAEILDQITGLGPATVVPGHGALGGAGDLERLAGYLRTLEAVVDDAVTSGLDEHDMGSIPVPPGSESWGGAGRFTESVSGLAGRRRR